MSWHPHASLLETKLRQLARTVETKFDPNQPRVPPGNPDGGQWTDGGGGGAVSGSAGSDTLIGGRRRDLIENLSDIRKEKPLSARLQNAVVKLVARHVSEVLLLEGEVRSSVGQLLNVLEVASWVREFVPYIQAYSDPPRSLEELQSSVLTPARGYDIHHIVEQAPAEQDGFPRSQIDSPENLVRIPTLKHWQITGWFNAKNDSYGGVSPRNYLRGKDWTERMRVGRDALVRYKVLKP